MRVLSHHPRVRRCRAGDERGAILILALAFVVIIGVVAAALVTFAWAGARATTAYRVERTRRYGADSALQYAITKIKADPTMSITSTASTCAQYTLQQDITGGKQQSVLISGAKLIVTCKLTPGVTPPNFVLDGGQKPRDVTLEVVCQHNGSAVKVDTDGLRKLQCGTSTGVDQVVGRARVRFDLDKSQPINQRASVPKVLSWTLAPCATRSTC